MLQLHLLISIHFCPPGTIILQPLGKPGKDGVLPLQSLLIIDDVMILTIYQYHRRRTAEEFQSRIELDALAHRHIIIGSSVNKQQWSMNLVGIIERTLIYKEMLVGPRIFVRHRNLAVAVAPIALTPIAGVVADACMRDGSSKEVGLGLKILGHESAVAGADAANLLAVHESYAHRRKPGCWR